MHVRVWSQFESAGQNRVPLLEEPARLRGQAHRGREEQARRYCMLEHYHSCFTFVIDRWIHIANSAYSMMNNGDNVVRQERRPLDPREEGVLASHDEVVELPRPAAAQRPHPAQVRERRCHRHGGHRHLDGLGVLLRRGPPAAAGQLEGHLPHQLHVQQVRTSSVSTHGTIH
jgi:hypothetical protein